MCSFIFFRLLVQATKSRLNYAPSTIHLNFYILLLPHTPSMLSQISLWLSIWVAYTIHFVEQWTQHGESNIILAIKMAFSKSSQDVLLCIIDFFSSSDYTFSLGVCLSVCVYVYLTKTTFLFHQFSHSRWFFFFSFTSQTKKLSLKCFPFCKKLWKRFALLLSVVLRQVWW